MYNMINQPKLEITSDFDKFKIGSKIIITIFIYIFFIISRNIFGIIAKITHFNYIVIRHYKYICVVFILFIHIFYNYLYIIFTNSKASSVPNCYPMFFYSIHMFFSSITFIAIKTIFCN